MARLLSTSFLKLGHSAVCKSAINAVARHGRRTFSSVIDGRYQNISLMQCVHSSGRILGYMLLLCFQCEIYLTDMIAIQSFTNFRKKIIIIFEMIKNCLTTQCLFQIFREKKRQPAIIFDLNQIRFALSQVSALLVNIG